MIFGVGIDIIEVSRLKEKDAHFLNTIFTSDEINYCNQKKTKEMFFAARFAAKEAFLKAMGTGLRDGLKFNEIEIIHDNLGKPSINVYGKAKEFILNNILSIQVSISHISEMAIAIVILERKGA